jgi:hypothetical protein
LQASGIPPIVPGLLTVASLRQTPGVYNLVTFAQAGRVWGAQLSSTFSAGAAYAAAVNNVFHSIQTQSGLTLAVVELAVAAPSTVDNAGADAPPFGLDIAAGDIVQLNVNNGTAVTGAFQRCSAVVFYTVP